MPIPYNHPYTNPGGNYGSAYEPDMSQSMPGQQASQRFVPGKDPRTRGGILPSYYDRLRLEQIRNKYRTMANPGEEPTDPWGTVGAAAGEAMQDNKPPAAEDGGGDGGGGGRESVGSGYTPPPMTPSPFIMPDGTIPPGLPYSPNTEMQALQDSILKQMLTTPALSEEFISRQNEAQKEMLLQRGQQGSQALAQSAARRGASGGAYLQGQQRRASDVLTSQLLGSQRDIANQAELSNRQGYIDALGASEGILGARQDRGLSVAKFAEMIRQFEENLKNRQAEFGSSLDYDYSQLNSSLEQQFIEALLAAGGGI